MLNKVPPGDSRVIRNLPISTFFTGQARGTGDFDGDGLGVSDIAPFVATCS